MNETLETRTQGWGRMSLGRRVPGWLNALERWAFDAHSLPFGWGVTDCNVLACEAVDLQLGTSLASRMRGKYSDADSALAHRDAIAWDLRVELISAGLRLVTETEAVEPGDILTAPLAPWTAAHVAISARRALSSLPGHGVVIVPVARIAGWAGLQGYTVREERQQCRL